MGKQGSLIRNMLAGRELAWWRSRADQAARLSLNDLRSGRSKARALRGELERFLRIAEDRLALPRIGSSAIMLPYNTDWSWRPALWRTPLPVPGQSSAQTKTMLGDEVTLFHDCRHSELTLRQLRNQREADLAPYGLRMDVFGFDGSFLSIVLDLPPEAAQGLLRRHLVRLDSIIEVEAPLEIFARLNVRHGPNTEQFVREISLEQAAAVVEFDLAYSNINEKRVEKVWLDLIFENPQMNQVVIRDLTFSRRPRAEI
ncbi:DUF6478 family protein [Pseudooceanicola nanhaiensis]|uniref:DUF6478 family protein n=1 Tax=Pseudooceanicola nanhaiensis TaxID=375761 RepID=UPI001CD50C7F|nr:DUF6478 family protein [Pseudooceanicola nanhaiensis]MCA0921789.1 DUF6478 family protein [Pseudooceanicola nanhaiensis]